VIPPLRERPEDIPLLVDHFAKQLPNQKRLTPAALAALSEYDWPGNVRELHFAVERAGLLAEGEMIDVEDLPPEIVEKTGRVAVSTPSATTAALAEASAATLDDLGGDPEEGPDLARVKAALEKAKWRREKAAEILGVSPRTLYRWIKKLGL
jgi:DNA-binding NtrC family response regulator